MTKNKKIFLTLGAITTTATVMPVVISCTRLKNIVNKYKNRKTPSGTEEERRKNEEARREEENKKLKEKEAK